MEEHGNNECIIPLESIGSIDETGLPPIGNKALGLARLARLGLPVPAGFCICTDAYREHMERCQAESLIQELPGADISSMLAVVRGKIMEEPLSSTLMASMEASLGRLEAPAVAVRSSATCEDMACHSSAGLYETCIGPAGRCAENIKKCWASFWSERAYRYREKYGIDHCSSAMAVIVQRLIPADSSGVIFTCEPVKGRNDRMVIEACFGLGEALVSGRVTPDRFVVDRENVRIIERHIAEKTLKLELSPEGATNECLLSCKESVKPALDAKTIKTLSSLALKAEPFPGEGQDIEWALEKGRLFLLQCRPITGSGATSSPLHVWTNANAGEVLPDVVTPMTYSLVSQFIDLLFLGNLRSLGMDFGDLALIELIDGRLYFDMTALSEMVHYVPGFGRLKVGKLLGGHQEKLIGSLLRRHPGGFAHPRFNMVRLLFNLPFFMARMALRTAGGAERLIGRSKKMTRKLYEHNLSSLTDAQLMELLSSSIQAMVDGIPEDMATISGAFPAYQGLRAVCKKWLASEDGSLTHRLLMGTGHVDSADPGISLLEIAAHIRSSRELTECIHGIDMFRELRENAAALEGGACFLRLWDDFMEKHGHHARGELEFCNPRWAECPDYVLSIVKGYIENFDRLDMKAVYEKRVRERQILVRECRGRLVNPIHRVIFDYLLSKAQQGLALRERYKNEAVKKIAAYRLIYLELGGRYAARGVLDRQDDIFFLYGDELGALHQGTLSLHVKETIAGRHSEHNKNLAVIPHPVVVGTRENRNYVSFDADEALAVFTGIAVSPGIARGPARVCVSKDDDISISPGEILVIPFADPGWSPYFIPSAGIVMDMGGILSHGSIIAREYGIPTVVNVGTATKMIKTGQVIEVDGNSGTVRVIA